MDKHPSPDELAARIEIVQERLATTTQEIRHELSPETLKAKGRECVQRKVDEVTRDESGNLRPAVIVVGVSLGLAALGWVITRVIR